MKRLKIVAHNEQSLRRLYGMSEKFKVGIYDGYIDTAKYLKSTVKKDMRDDKTGRIYTRRLRGRLVRHRASAPDEAPAIFTGALEKTIATKTSGYRDLEFSAGGGKVKYARALEKGYAPRNLAPRRYMITAINKNERNTLEAFYRNISLKINKI